MGTVSQPHGSSSAAEGFALVVAATAAGLECWARFIGLLLPVAGGIAVAFLGESDSSSQSET